mmetsp:Transcript_8253/g.22702  ORF Transcript_8253/g.22702 Transcript_8253/m.22702 type:complete len:708 (-) Transcript_8253:59-2182(-)
MCDCGQEVPAVVAPGGTWMGARKPPSACAKCCCPSCAISGYEQGDLTKGCLSCEGPACHACCLQPCCFMGALYAFWCWEPRPENIKGDASQRTADLLSCCLAGWCCTVSFWEAGDMCSWMWCHGPRWMLVDVAVLSLLFVLMLALSQTLNDNQGAAMMAVFLVVGGVVLWHFKSWSFDPRGFLRSPDMHGAGRDELVGTPVQVAMDEQAYLFEVHAPRGSTPFDKHTCLPGSGSNFTPAWHAAHSFLCRTSATGEVVRVYVPPGKSGVEVERLVQGIDPAKYDLNRECRQSIVERAREIDQQSASEQGIFPGADYLHRNIGAEFWGITMAAFVDFMDCVREKIAAGAVHNPEPPPGREQYPETKFSSLEIGPNMHHINADVIKPMTRDADNFIPGVSWALRHDPAGNLCTIFVTHAWNEGVFEFERGLKAAWPKHSCATCPSGHALGPPVTTASSREQCPCCLHTRYQSVYECSQCSFKGCSKCAAPQEHHIPGAAYICFLSNPQNLNIKDMLDNVETSPFNVALTKMPKPGCFLMIGTENEAIHNRLWCVFEAHVALMKNIPITPPLNSLHLAAKREIVESTEKQLWHQRASVLTLVAGLRLGQTIVVIPLFFTAFAFRLMGPVGVIPAVAIRHLLDKLCRHADEKVERMLSDGHKKDEETIAGAEAIDVQNAKCHPDDEDKIRLAISGHENAINKMIREQIFQYS